MNVREIVKKHLENNKYDGLFNLGVGCGCQISDLMPCETFGDSNGLGCEAGYKVPCDCGDHDFHIAPEKK